MSSVHSGQIRTVTHNPVSLDLRKIFKRTACDLWPSIRKSPYRPMASLRRSLVHSLSSSLWVFLFRLAVYFSWRFFFFIYFLLSLCASYARINQYVQINILISHTHKTYFCCKYIHVHSELKTHFYYMYINAHIRISFSSNYLSACSYFPFSFSDIYSPLSLFIHPPSLSHSSVTLPLPPFLHLSFQSDPHPLPSPTPPFFLPTSRALRWQRTKFVCLSGDKEMVVGGREKGREGGW